MRLIADKLLRECAARDGKTRHETTYVQAELARAKRPVLPSPRYGRSFHVYCSHHNLGAAELMRELIEDYRVDVEVTHATEECAHCEHMLIYLNSQTWTRGEASAAFADEVRAAMEGQVHLLLAHEMPGVGGQLVRHGVDFGTFFASTEGATPKDLILAGIYTSIAIPLKGGAWREASMVMFIQTLAAEEAELAEQPLLKRQSSGISRWLQLRATKQLRVVPDSVDKFTQAGEQSQTSPRRDKSSVVSRLRAAQAASAAVAVQPAARRRRISSVLALGHVWPRRVTVSSVQAKYAADARLPEHLAPCDVCAPSTSFASASAAQMPASSAEVALSLSAATLQGSAVSEAPAALTPAAEAPAAEAPAAAPAPSAPASSTACTPSYTPPLRRIRQPVRVQGSRSHWELDRAESAGEERRIARRHAPVLRQHEEPVRIATGDHVLPPDASLPQPHNNGTLVLDHGRRISPVLRREPREVALPPSTAARRACQMSRQPAGVCGALSQSQSVGTLVRIAPVLASPLPPAQYHDRAPGCGRSAPRGGIIQHATTSGWSAPCHSVLTEVQTLMTGGRT